MSFARFGVKIIGCVRPIRIKGQISLEFMFVIMLLLFLTILFVIASGNKMNEFKNEKDVFLLRDTASSVRNEVKIAYAMDSGYVRSFDVPDTLEGLNYSIVIQNNFVSASVDDQLVEVAIQPVNGTLQKGTNVIRKVGSIVYLNS